MEVRETDECVPKGACKGRLTKDVFLHYDCAGGGCVGCVRGAR